MELHNPQPKLTPQALDLHDIARNLDKLLSASLAWLDFVHALGQQYDNLQLMRDLHTANNHFWHACTALQCHLSAALRRYKQ